MNHLAPCPCCQRHVRVSESACPFCCAAIDLSYVPEPLLPSRRLGRAALFAFGATLAASLSTTACGGQSESDKGTGGASGGSGGSTGGTGGSGGSTGGSGGSTGGSGGDAGAGFGGFAGAQTLYGLPVDAGPDDAGVGGQNFGGGSGGGQPLYGAPPDTPDPGEDLEP